MNEIKEAMNGVPEYIVDRTMAYLAENDITGAIRYISKVGTQYNKELDAYMEYLETYKEDMEDDGYAGLVYALFYHRAENVMKYIQSLVNVFNLMERKFKMICA